MVNDDHEAPVEHWNWERIISWIICPLLVIIIGVMQSHITRLGQSLSELEMKKREMNITIGNKDYTIFKLRDDLKSEKLNNQLLSEDNGSLRKSFEECYVKRDELQMNYTQTLLSLTECSILKKNLEKQYSECRKNERQLDNMYAECSRQKDKIQRDLRKQKNEYAIISTEYPQIELKDLSSTFGKELNDIVDYEISCIVGNGETDSSIGNTGEFNDILVISDYDELETIRFGHQCHKKIQRLVIKNLPNLKSIYFGKNSFSLYEDTSKRLKKESTLAIMNCPKLTSIKLDDGAFQYYESLILQSIFQ